MATLKFDVTISIFSKMKALEMESFIGMIETFTYFTPTELLDDLSV